ncbi:MAG: type II toxin-antitoxin system VapB family antitoxin [Planctomycetota bacterium]|nr:MAG: type II toxin-antitoxin system VapB family antitoxin [Planctomycetota bacterium]
MATNLAIDDALVDEAKKLGKHKSKREAVNQALRDYVQKFQQLKILETFHDFDFYDAFDYKAGRSR